MENDNINEEELYEAVKNSFSYAGTVRFLGKDPNKDTRFLTSVKKKIKEFDFDTSHWYNKSYKKNFNNNSLEYILVENSWYTNTPQLKERLINENLLVNVCYLCGLDSFWHGKNLVLQLDHINGNNRDHRLSNLRILCPNCHSQTTTYAGKNKKRL